MSDFHQQAIEDVARMCGDDEAFVRIYAEGENGDDDYGKAIAYAVAQRERVLGLEAALHCIATWGDCMLRPDDLSGETLEAFSLGSSKAFEQQAKMARDALAAPEKAEP